MFSILIKRFDRFSRPTLFSQIIKELDDMETSPVVIIGFLIILALTPSSIQDVVGKYKN